jgi:outer membrane protein TolC
MTERIKRRILLNRPLFKVSFQPVNVKDVFIGKTARAVIHFYIYLFFLFAGTPLSAKVFTLEQLIESAIDNSKSVKHIKKDMEMANVQVQKVYGNLLPSVTASIDLNHAFAQFIPYTFRNMDNFDQLGSSAFQLNQVGIAAAGTPERGIASTYETDGVRQFENRSFEELIDLPRNRISAVVGVRQPLFSQGKTLISLRIARNRQSLLVCRYEEVKNSIKREVVKEFYSVLIAQKRITLRKDRIALAEESHRLTVVKFSCARARELDTLNSLLQLEEARIDLHDAEGERRNACESWIASGGIAESPETFWVEGEFTEPVFFITIDEALTLLRERNYVISQFRGEENVLNGMINLAKADYLPQIYGGGTVGRIGQFARYETMDDIRWGDDQSVFLGLSWTLFSGFTRQQEIRQKIIERDQLRLKQQEQIEKLELETRRTFEKIMISKERLRLLEKMVGIAEKGHEIARKAYEVGSGTLFDLQGAELELNAARLRYNETLYEFHVAVVDFRFLIGNM